MNIGWFGRWRYRRLKAYYTRQLLYYKKLAEYNLYRHDEAVESYNQRKASRSYGGRATNNELGFFIAYENADSYAMHYNINWELYIKYRHKLEVIEYNNNNLLVS